MVEHRDIPAGWVWERLGNHHIIKEIIMGQSPPSNTYNDEGRGLPFFQGKADFGDLYPTPRKWYTSPKKESLPGDVLISVRAPVGPTNLTVERCAIGRGLAALRPNPERVDSSYLLFALRFLEKKIALSGAGSTFPAITKKQLEDTEIPLPYPDDPQRSLAEQRRIVARLEMMLTEVREMRAIIREMRKDVDRLMEAALEEVFPEYGQKLPGGWEWRPVKYVATETTRRNPRANVQSSQRLLTSPSENMLEQKRDGADIGFRYVEISSVDNRNCRIVLEKVKYILNKDAPGRARQVIHENDVIFATTRPYLKNIALIPNELNGEICSTGFCVLCPIPERIVPKFLFYAVRANSFVKQLLSRQKGATYPAITDEDVFANQIPLPYPNEPNRSKAVQHHIVAYLEAVEDEILSVQKLLDQDEQAVNQLEQSILEAAFRGEI
jgi:type I restriction enzyme S subunit